MPQSLADLEAKRSSLLQQFLSLGDFRPGTVSAVVRRCGKSNCHCAQPDSAGHPQLRLLRKVKGRSVSESFPSPAALRQAAEQVHEFHRFRQLSAELTALNEQICRLRPVEAEGGWSKEEKQRLLRFIKKPREGPAASPGSSRRSAHEPFVGPGSSRTGGAQQTPKRKDAQDHTTRDH
jgi:hypothetical protein